MRSGWSPALKPSRVKAWSRLKSFILRSARGLVTVRLTMVRSPAPFRVRLGRTMGEIVAVLYTFEGFE